MSVPVLYYFDGPGRGEAIRLAFVVGGIEFEDFRIPLEQWASKYKALCPTGRVPVLEVGGYKYCESSAILMYAGKRAGLIPDDPIDLMTMWQAMMALEPCWPIVTPIHLCEPETREQILMEQTKLLKVELEKYSSLILNFQHEKGYLSGEALSLSDIVLYAFTLHVNGTMLDMKFDFSSYPRINKVIRLVETNPSVANYYA